MTEDIEARASIFRGEENGEAMKHLVALSLAVVLSCLTACGEGEEPAAATEGPDVPTIVLTPRDSIGVAMGDSNYVLGVIGEATFDLEGNVMILDERAACVRQYTPSGEFIRQFSRHGSGPGETLMPGAMAVLSNGDVIMIDHPTGGVHSFTPEGEWKGLLIDFQGQSVPQWAWPVDGDAFVAAMIDGEMTDDGLMITYDLGRFSDSVSTDVTYWETSFPWDLADVAGFLEKTIFAVAYAADREGYVYVAPVSSEDYTVSVYDRDGELVSEFSREFARVEKSEEELQNERDMIETIMRERGAEQFGQAFEPDPYRWMIPIFGIGVDSWGRIWVRRGVTEELVLDIYDREGNQLFVARVENVGESVEDYIQVYVKERGMLVCPVTPEDYPKIYIIDLPEPESA